MTDEQRGSLSLYRLLRGLDRRTRARVVRGLVRGEREFVLLGDGTAPSRPDPVPPADDAPSEAPARRLPDDLLRRIEEWASLPDRSAAADDEARRLCAEVGRALGLD